MLAKAGIQKFRDVAIVLDSRLRGNERSVVLQNFPASRFTSRYKNSLLS